MSRLKPSECGARVFQAGHPYADQWIALTKTKTQRKPSLEYFPTKAAAQARAVDFERTACQGKRRRPKQIKFDF